MKVTCAFCGSKSDKAAGEVSRAKKAGRRLYCNRRCSGMARRDFKSAALKAAEKAEYDAAYRARNTARIKARKAEAFKRTYDPAIAARDRKKTMARHIAYCQRPEYREWKRGYDIKYRAQRDYGEWADAFVLLQEVATEVHERMTDYDIRVANGTINKKLNRRRTYETAFGL